MPHDILISPQLDATQRKTLTRQAEQLDRLLERQQPIAQTGVLEQLGSSLWTASGLQPDALKRNCCSPRWIGPGRKAISSSMWLRMVACQPW